MRTPIGCWRSSIAPGVRATFFVLGWVAERYPALVRRIAAGGHEIASHGYGHRLIYDDSAEAFRADLRRAKRAIEDAAGVPVFGYRAPSYSITARSLWALDILIEEGYQYDASIFPIHHDRYGIAASPRHAYRIWRRHGSLWELPGSTVRLAGRQSAGRRRRLLQAASVRVDEVGHRPGESPRRAAGRVLSASVGNRSRTSRVYALPKLTQRPSLRQSRPDRSAARTAARRLPVRRDLRGQPDRAARGRMNHEDTTDTDRTTETRRCFV